MLVVEQTIKTQSPFQNKYFHVVFSDKQIPHLGQDEKVSSQGAWMVPSLQRGK